MSTVIYRDYINIMHHPSDIPFFCLLASHERHDKYETKLKKYLVDTDDKVEYNQEWEESVSHSLQFEVSGPSSAAFPMGPPEGLAPAAPASSSGSRGKRPATHDENDDSDDGMISEQTESSSDDEDAKTTKSSSHGKRKRATNSNSEGENKRGRPDRSEGHVDEIPEDMVLKNNLFFRASCGLKDP